MPTSTVHSFGSNLPESCIQIHMMSYRNLAYIMDIIKTARSPLEAETYKMDTIVVVAVVHQSVLCILVLDLAKY